MDPIVGGNVESPYFDFDWMPSTLNYLERNKVETSF